MKTPSPKPTHDRQTGFTLIEMIGVLAMMAIMAATIAPNALRVIERSAVRSEAETLRSLGEQAKLYLRDNGVELTVANWNSATGLATYSWLNPTDLLYNRRQPMNNNPADRSRTESVYANQNNYITRVYVPDPNVAKHRALLVSSMRFGIPLPAQLLPTPTPSISANNFATVWDTPDGFVPAVPGWAAWNNLAEFLVIERINYLPIYMTELQSVTVSLINRSTGPLSYNRVLANGTSQTAVLIPAPIPPLTSNIISVITRPRERINLYHPGPTGLPILDYSYIVPTGSSGRTFDYTTATNWVPLP